MKETYEMIAREMRELTELIDLNKSSLMAAVERNDLNSVNYFLKLWKSYQGEYQKCLKKMDERKLRFRAT